ncbi:helix-turn-helix transcriptional regulator [Oscillospiraceae bacterium 44-34]|mgnify:CR=1 FL=1|jgi:transcriptional regulator with XRE-family HTH domain
MEYYERLRQAREDKDETQAQIAELLQTNQSYLSKMELGKKPFRVEQLMKLCEYYGVSADYILGLPKGLEWPRD